MSLFDANTLLQVSAAFHGFMALVWLLMSQVFRRTFFHRRSALAYNALDLKSRWRRYLRAWLGI